MTADRDNIQPQKPVAAPSDRHEEPPPALIYALLIGAILFFVALEIPYRPIHIPQPALIASGLCATLLIVFLAFENYVIAIILLIAYLPFSGILTGDFGGFLFAFNLTNILLIIVIIGWIARGSLRGERIYSATALDFPLLLFCLWYVISVVRGAYDGNLDDHVIILLKRDFTPYLLFFIFANNIRSRREMEYILVGVAVITTMVAIMTLKEFYLDIGPMSNIDKMRVRGICQQPNELAAFFCYYAPYVAVPLLRDLHARRLWFLAAAYFLCGWALTRTISRGGTIAYRASVLAVLWFWRRRAAIAVALAAIFIFTFLPSLVPGSIIGRFRSTWKDLPTLTNIANPQNLEPSAAGRINTWKRAIPFIRQNPFFGIGYKNFQRIFGIDAHNFYILLATEMGIPAVLFFLHIIFRLAGAAAYLQRHSADWRLQWLAHGCLASIAGMLVANLFGSRMNSQELTSLFWILAGPVMNAARRMQEGDPEFGAPLAPGRDEARQMRKPLPQEETCKPPGDG